MRQLKVNPLNANPTKWSNALKQFVGKLLTNCLIVFNHFVGLTFKVNLHERQKQTTSSLWSIEKTNLGKMEIFRTNKKRVRLK